MEKNTIEFYMRPLIIILLFGISLICKANDIPLIAASSDLHDVLPKLASQFAKQTGETIHFKFGSSNALSWQIYHGTPYQLFLADDEDSIIKMIRFGKARNSGKIYAIGHLALFAPHGSSLSSPLSFSKLAFLVKQNRIIRFAVPNTEHCAYGRAARQVLVHLKLWVKLQPEIIPTPNSYTTARAALNADGGIIPYSLAIAPEFTNQGHFILIPQNLYNPIQQHMVLLNNAGKTALDFYSWLQTPEARSIFTKNGYDVPKGN